ncbi:hypothetical protein FH968_23505, partial [Buttiauxella sp. B2]|uniref:Ig-like domain-containing protein n=1 Tax=Buttiauxella sp. B2 TaxID=2587812 RepID=UPI001174CCFD
GAGIVISIYANTEFLGHATIGDDGFWSFTPEQPLEVNQEYIFQTLVQDPGSDALLISLPYKVYTIETNGDVPATISLDSIVDNIRGFYGYTGALPDDGRGLTNDAHPDLSGKANAGARVNVYDNGTLIGSTTVGADGSWKFTPATALKDGTHVLVATVVTAIGESSPTAGFTITVDTVNSQPILDTVQDNVGTVQTLVSNGGLTDDSRPVLTGHAEAGSRVDIHVFGPNGKALYYQSVTAGNDGSWTYQPKAFTTHGNYSFGITGIDQAGNAWRTYGDKFTVKYVGSNQDDTSVPDAATGLVLHDDVGSIKTDIQNKGITDDSKPTLSGHADAGDIVLVYDNNKVIGSATVASNGNWSFTPATALNDGSHSFTTVVKNVDNGHTSAASAAIGFTVDTVITAPVITGVWDNVGTKTGNVANGGVTDDILPKISGTAEAGSMVTITLTGPAGQRYTYDAVQADQNGNWHYYVVGELGWTAGNSRAFTFTATAADVAGNVSHSSEKYVINYVDSNQDDTSVPDAATGLVLHDDVGSIKTDIQNKGITDDSKPALSGHADAGDIV